MQWRTTSNQCRSWEPGARSRGGSSFCSVSLLFRVDTTSCPSSSCWLSQHTTATSLSTVTWAKFGSKPASQYRYRKQFGSGLKGQTEWFLIAIDWSEWKLTRLTRCVITCCFIISVFQWNPSPNPKFDLLLSFFHVLDPLQASIINLFIISVVQYVKGSSVVMIHWKWLADTLQVPLSLKLNRMKRKIHRTPPESLAFWTWWRPAKRKNVNIDYCMHVM